MAAITSQGSKLQVSISAVFTDVTTIFESPTPSATAEYDDVTTLASSGYKEYFAVLKDVSNLSFSGIWDPSVASLAYLRAANLTQTATESFKVILSDASSYTVAFSAYVAKFEIVAAAGKAQRFSMDLRVSGAVTDTP